MRYSDQSVSVQGAQLGSFLQLSCNEAHELTFELRQMGGFGTKGTGTEVKGKHRRETEQVCNPNLQSEVGGWLAMHVY